MSATNPLEERSDRRPRAVCLMGPTASGKTALAVALAERRGYAVISVDSALVYRGMDVGTAKPDPATLARVPHALVDIRDPEQGYSAAEFRADALHAGIGVEIRFDLFFTYFLPLTVRVGIAAGLDSEGGVYPTLGISLPPLLPGSATWRQ